MTYLIISLVYLIVAVAAWFLIRLRDQCFNWQHVGVKIVVCTFWFTIPIIFIQHKLGDYLVKKYGDKPIPKWLK